jgi:hypothetical protein
MNIDDITIPDSNAARAALEVATEFHTPALLNHCIRSYVWGAAFAMLNGRGFDAELLYVSSLLHDIGLVDEFDSHTSDFERSSAAVARVFGAAAGWPVERRERASEIIVVHMTEDLVPFEQDPEGYLLSIATSLDISGSESDLWPLQFRKEVVARYPRHALASEFLLCFAGQAARKPTSPAGVLMAEGFGPLIQSNALDSY